MRFTWTFLPTVTIDLADQKASVMPSVTAQNGRFVGQFAMSGGGAGACGGHTVPNG